MRSWNVVEINHSGSQSWKHCGPITVNKYEAHFWTIFRLSEASNVDKLSLFGYFWMLLLLQYTFLDFVLFLLLFLKKLGFLIEWEKFNGPPKNTRDPPIQKHCM